MLTKAPSKLYTDIYTYYDKPEYSTNNKDTLQNAEDIPIKFLSNISSIVSKLSKPHVSFKPLETENLQQQKPEGQLTTTGPISVVLSSFGYNKDFHNFVNRINDVDNLQQKISILDSIFTHSRLTNDVNLFTKVLKEYNNYPLTTKTLKSNIYDNNNIIKHKIYDTSDTLYTQEYKHVSNKEFLEDLENYNITNSIRNDSITKSISDDIQAKHNTNIYELNDLPLECYMFMYTGFNKLNLIYYIQYVNTYNFLSLINSFIDYGDDNTEIHGAILKIYDYYNRYSDTTDLQTQLKFLYDRLNTENNTTDKYYIYSAIKTLYKGEYLQPHTNIKEHNPQWKTTGYLFNTFKTITLKSEDEKLTIKIPYQDNLDKLYTRPVYPIDMELLAEELSDNREVREFIMTNKIVYTNNTTNNKDIATKVKHSIKEYILRQIYDSFSDNIDLNRWYGLTNKMLYGSSFTDEHHVCRVYGGCRMFECLHHVNTDMVYMNNTSMNNTSKNKSMNKPWFKGKCDICPKSMKSYHHAVRRPILTGGWQGCYCSWDCVRKFYMNVLHYEDSYETQIDREYDMYDMHIDYFEERYEKEGVEDR